MLSELEVKETGRLSNTMSVSRCMGSCVLTHTHSHTERGKGERGHIKKKKGRVMLCELEFKKTA